MKPVVQRDRTGCGIAAVAAIAGVSYTRAKAVAASVGIFVHERSLWSETEPVQRLLSQFGIRVARTPRPFRSWTELPDCALLAIKWHQEAHRPCWHWVVFVRDGVCEYVLDSKASLSTPVRVDFGRIQPKWFLSVTHHPPARVMRRADAVVGECGSASIHGKTAARS